MHTALIHTWRRLYGESTVGYLSYQRRGEHEVAFFEQLCEAFDVVAVEEETLASLTCEHEGPDRAKVRVFRVTRRKGSGT